MAENYGQDNEDLGYEMQNQDDDDEGPPDLEHDMD